jgi:hypothetical protein
MNALPTKVAATAVTRRVRRAIILFAVFASTSSGAGPAYQQYRDRRSAQDQFRRLEGLPPERLSALAAGAGSIGAVYRRERAPESVFVPSPGLMVDKAGESAIRTSPYSVGQLYAIVLLSR